jgi:hypothetical protein
MDDLTESDSDSEQVMQGHPSVLLANTGDGQPVLKKRKRTTTVEQERSIVELQSMDIRSSDQEVELVRLKKLQQGRARRLAKTKAKEDAFVVHQQSLRATAPAPLLAPVIQNESVIKELKEEINRLKVDKTHFQDLSNTLVAACFKYKSTTIELREENSSLSTYSARVERLNGKLEERLSKKKEQEQKKEKDALDKLHLQRLCQEAKEEREAQAEEAQEEQNEIDHERAITVWRLHSVLSTEGTCSICSVTNADHVNMKCGHMLCQVCTEVQVTQPKASRKCAECRGSCERENFIKCYLKV